MFASRSTPPDNRRCSFSRASTDGDTLRIGLLLTSVLDTRHDRTGHPRLGDLRTSPSTTLTVSLTASNLRNDDTGSAGETGSTPADCRGDGVPPGSVRKLV